MRSAARYSPATRGKIDTEARIDAINEFIRINNPQPLDLVSGEVGELMTKNNELFDLVNNALTEIQANAELIQVRLSEAV
jgi:hypothetical protein